MSEKCHRRMRRRTAGDVPQASAGLLRGRMALIRKRLVFLRRARMLVVIPPFERPMTWFCVPFCPLSVAVNLDDGGIDHDALHVRLV